MAHTVTERNKRISESRGQNISPVAMNQPAGWPDQVSAFEEMWLLGLPSLEHYLNFVEEDGTEGSAVNRVALIDDWRKANDYYLDLEKREAGIANQVTRSELDPSLAALAAQLRTHSRFRETFDSLPTAFGMVELDRLIVYQKHVSRNFVETLKTNLTPAPDAAEMFRFCLPLGKPKAPVQMRRLGPPL